MTNRPVSFNDPTGHDYDCGVLLCPEDMRDDGPPPPDPEDDSKSDLDSNVEYCSQYRFRTGCVPPLVGEELNYAVWKNSPDYYSLSGIIPLCPLGVPICGIAISITIDKYGNVYVAGGVGIGLPVTVSLAGGWFLGPDNDNEKFAENYLQGHAFNAGGGGSPFGIGPGIAVNNNYPSYIQAHNEGSKIENIAIEGLITTTGIDVMGIYGWLLYDNGDDTPWIWQGD